MVFAQKDWLGPKPLQNLKNRHFRGSFVFNWHRQLFEKKKTLFWGWAEFANKSGDHFFGTAIFGDEATIKIGFSEFHAGNPTKIGISRGEVPSEHFCPGSSINKWVFRGIHCHF